MKVEQLISELQKADADMDIFCYVEDDGANGLLQVLEIDYVELVEAEMFRDADGVGRLKFERTETSKRVVLINVLTDF